MGQNKRDLLLIMKRSNDSNEEDEHSINPPNSSEFQRLGKCEVCNYKTAKYTCPKCEIKTCCIKCLNIHKKELSCDGVRDRTKYKPLKKMTRMDFMNDYYFLEECTRYVDNRKTDKIKRYTRYNKILPSHLFKLRNAALERKTTLRFLLPNFKRHSSNTTYYDWKTQLISWRVEWIFVNAGFIKYVDTRCTENATLVQLLEKYLCVAYEEEIPKKNLLEMYQSRGIGNLKILLKAEGIKRCAKRYYELDCKKTLRENLAQKIIVDFPEIHVLYDLIPDAYDVIDSDEDVIDEARKLENDLNENYKSQIADMNRIKTEDEIQKETEENEKRIKLAARKKRRAERKTKPRNFLFSAENASDSSSSDSDTQVTEEET